MGTPSPEEDSLHVAAVHWRSCPRCPAIEGHAVSRGGQHLGVRGAGSCLGLPVLPAVSLPPEEGLLSPQGSWDVQCGACARVCEGTVAVSDGISQASSALPSGPGWPCGVDPALSACSVDSLESTMQLPMLRPLLLRSAVQVLAPSSLPWVTSARCSVLAPVPSGLEDVVNSLVQS